MGSRAFIGTRLSISNGSHITNIRKSIFICFKYSSLPFWSSFYKAKCNKSLLLTFVNISNSDVLQIWIVIYDKSPGTLKCSTIWCNLSKPTKSDGKSNSFSPFMKSKIILKSLPGMPTLTASLTYGPSVTAGWESNVSTLFTVAASNCTLTDCMKPLAKF